MNGSNNDLSNSKNSSSGSSAASTRLDPKYFQSNSPQLSNSLDVVSIRPQMMRTTLTATTNTIGIGGTGSTNSTSSTAVARLNKPLVHQTSFGGSVQPNMPITNGTNNQIAQYTNGVSSKSTPSLASAYFPASN